MGLRQDEAESIIHQKEEEEQGEDDDGKGTRGSAKYVQTNKRATACRRSETYI